MKVRKIIALLAIVFPVVLSAAPADLVLRHGKIYTMNPKQEWAESLAIQDGRLVYVGSDAEIPKYVGSKTKVLELSNRLVLPSFIDSHVHPIGAGIEMGQLYLGDMKTKEEILAAIKKYAAEHPKSLWVLGNTWQLPVFPEANPKKEWLDEIEPDRPVYMDSADGHSIWVNSKALEIAGVNKNTPDPPNGRIERDQNGEPSGTCRESASRLIREVMPQPTPEELLSALQRAVKEMNRLGITGFQDASVRPPYFDTYRKAEQDGTLTARVTTAQYADPKLPIDQIEQMKKIRQEFHGKHFAAGAIKIFADGVIEANTAALLEPYLDGKKDRGIYNWQPNAMNEFVKKADAEKFQLHFHAIGDGAIREALDALAYARKQNGPRDARPLIAHLELIDPADVPRFGSLHVLASFQPLWAFADPYIKDMTIPKLGPERSRWLYPIGSVLRDHGTLAFGSDWSVSSVNPLDGIEVAVTRCDPDSDSCKEPFLPMEKIDLPTALRAYTLGSAYANFWEKETGSLEAGKSADLIVLSENLFTIAPAEINKTKVLLTVFEGKEIYRSDQFVVK
jgi:predicted amidohydrolase YtcJ